LVPEWVFWAVTDGACEETTVHVEER
jgi:hypothetical protein